MNPNTITLQIGGALELLLRPAPPEIVPIVSVRFGNFQATARGNQMAYTMPVDTMIVVQVGYVDKYDNPAKIDGDVTWESSDDNLVSVTVDNKDSTICKIAAAGGEIGSAQVTATADADLGEGTRELVTTLDLTILGGEAVGGTINVMQEPQPISPHVEPRKK